MAIVVNGERIENAQVEAEIERLRPDYERMFADKPREEREVELREWSQENLIERVLFQQQLRKLNTPVPPAIVDATFEKLKKEFATTEELLKSFGTDENGIRSRIEQVTREKLVVQAIGRMAPAPTAGQVREYYEQNKERYRMGERVRVSHILVRLGGSANEVTAIDGMTRIDAEIRAGAPFEAAASKYAVDDVEDLGYIQRGQMPGEFDDIVFNLGPGQVSHVFRTRLGLHIAKVYDRRPPAVPPLQEIRKQVADDLTEQIKGDAFAAYLDYLHSIATVEFV
jgi:peptidyl-prolyl cis-trans isomerase C